MKNLLLFGGTRGVPAKIGEGSMLEKPRFLPKRGHGSEMSRPQEPSLKTTLKKVGESKKQLFKVKGRGGINISKGGKLPFTKQDSVEGRGYIYCDLKGLQQDLLIPGKKLLNRNMI